ncbi:LuxR C-terminal-related transcriptional regulator [Pseudoroseomonas globiformis]|uniref:LuxR C-terminal-related transcriptional regulator n=1 Tax=Teichococcus globiformis TaxID=2307229 RepID=A0ABV7G7T1_9PROT
MTMLDQPDQSGWHVLLLDRFPLRRAIFKSFLENSAQAEGQSCTVVEQEQGGLPAPPVSVILVDLGGLAGVSPELPQMPADPNPPPMAVIADHCGAEEVAACFAAGARGFITTTMSPQETVRALEFIIGGGVFFPPEVLLDCATPAARDCEPIMAQIDPVDESTFTLRQREVLEQLRRGYSNKLIGRELQMCESTVKVHVRQIMRKLGVSNRTQAALQALTAPDMSSGQAAAVAAMASLLPVGELAAAEAALPLRV